MTDFDPDSFNPEPEAESQEQADHYVRWCAHHFNRVTGDEETPRTYRTGKRAASWLLVVATAQLHLHDDVDIYRDVYMRNLSGHVTLARRIERQRPDVGLRDLIVGRSVLDCWLPEGRFSVNLLDAAKCAISALVAIEVHPLVDLWDVDAPDIWALIMYGGIELSNIAEEAGDEQIEYDDYAVKPHIGVIDKMNWQKVNNIASSIPGTPPLSAN